MPSLYWLSFVSDAEIFQGVVIVEARDEKNALHEVSRRNLNPGGQVMIVKVPPNHMDEARPYRNRLLQGPEIERIFGPNTSPEQRDEMIAGKRASVACSDCNNDAV